MLIILHLSGNKSYQTWLPVMEIRLRLYLTCSIWSRIKQASQYPGLVTYNLIKNRWKGLKSKFSYQAMMRLTRMFWLKIIPSKTRFSCWDVKYTLGKLVYRWPAITFQAKLALFMLQLLFHKRRMESTNSSNNLEASFTRPSINPPHKISNSKTRKLWKLLNLEVNCM